MEVTGVTLSYSDSLSYQQNTAFYNSTEGYVKEGNLDRQ